MIDELIAAFKEIVDKCEKNDHALLKLTEAVIDEMLIMDGKINLLNTRLNSLSDFVGAQVEKEQP